MPSSRFSYASEQLREIAVTVLEYAKSRGATAFECEVSEGFGQTVTVRRGEVETIEYSRDKGIGVTVYTGQQRGHASSSDFSPQAMRDTVDAALSIASFTAPDDAAGLADPDLLARTFPELDLWHPWDLPVERAIELAKVAEDAGFAAGSGIDNSEGATVTTQEAQSPRALVVWHFQHATMENAIKEHKSGFGLEKLPTQKFHANWAYLLMGQIAFNLLAWFKRRVLPPAYHQATIKTIRHHLLNLAGKLVHTARRCFLMISDRYRYQAVWRFAIGRLAHLQFG